MYKIHDQLLLLHVSPAFLTASAVQKKDISSHSPHHFSLVFFSLPLHTAHWDLVKILSVLFYFPAKLRQFQANSSARCWHSNREVLSASSGLDILEQFPPPSHTHTQLGQAGEPQENSDNDERQRDHSTAIRHSQSKMPQRCKKPRPFPTTPYY